MRYGLDGIPLFKFNIMIIKRLIAA